MTKMNSCDLPVSFRVIGYGETTRNLIKQIQALGYDCLACAMVKSPDEITPTDEDKMVIVLTMGNQTGLEDLLKSFYQAGVLTLLVSECDFTLTDEVCDSHTVAETSQFTDIVKSLVNPIFRQGRITYDFTELSRTLHDTGRFEICQADGRGIHCRIPNAISSISNRIGTGNGIENMSLIIISSNHPEPPLSANELAPFHDFIGSLPENLNVIWAMYDDDALPADIIRISAIVAGKRMKL